MGGVLLGVGKSWKREEGVCGSLSMIGGQTSDGSGVNWIESTSVGEGGIGDGSGELLGRVARSSSFGAVTELERLADFHSLCQLELFLVLQTAAADWLGLLKWVNTGCT